VLDDYKEGQALFYNMASNAILNNKVSHAYLFVSSSSKDINIIKAFAKSLICPSNKFSKSNCGNCNICFNIDNDNYPELKIIKPDGMWIKKEQLSDLKNDFNNKKVLGNKRVYIILECEKLNKYAANSILKFLEEPEDDIIAILVTSNINMVIDTIKSRCQIINLVKNNKKIDDFKNVSDVINFIKVLEEKKEKTIIYEKDLWLKKFKDRSENILAFETMIYFYNQVLLYKTIGKMQCFFEYEEMIKKLDLKVEDIILRLEVLIKARDLIKYNLNINLLLDKVIIFFGGFYENSWSDS